MALTYYFQKAATDTWNVYVTANGTPLGTAGGNPAPATTITFPANGGAPTAPAGAGGDRHPGVDATRTARRRCRSPASPLDSAGATQYGSAFGVTDLSQDGYAAGQLTASRSTRNGVVMARYSNGQTKPAGQLELATFRNPQGLQPMGGNAWARSFASGEPIVGAPGDGQPRRAAVRRARGVERRPDRPSSST